MEFIEKKNGEVWLVKWHDVEGRNITKAYLGKDYEEEIKEDKTIKKNLAEKKKGEE